MKVMAGAIDKVLSYSVCAYSSFAPSYVPDHIKVDNPRDQGSRWSSESNSPPQYLVLKLERPAIVKHIYFGKYEKNHVCNLKRFKVFGSLRADDNMVDLLEGGLRNDSVGENFPLKHSLHGKYFPCRFIKVMPLQSWGPSFNYSIWYIELRGTDEPSVVGPQMGWYEACKEKETLRLCLKYLRQRRFIDAYEALLRVPGVSFEHPFLSSWFDMLVDRGDFDGCERELKEAIANGMLNPYIESQPLKVEWEPLNSAGKPCVGPGMRGGHQMCIDVESRTIYLFGGWDGYRDLSDFWAFMIDEQRWVCLSQDTLQDGGPCPRSCHKMCIDPVGKVVYLLGRFVDSHMRSEKNMKGDFFAYDLRAHKWVLLSEDTAEEGGPPLLFDHQLTFDAESETVFVCGGRSSAVASPGTVADPVLVGLYAYSIRTRTWRELRKDCADPAPSATTMRSRGGHSVVLHPKTRVLYIFGGQRNKHSLNDMMIYRIDTDELEMVYKGDEEGFCGPPAGLTQRATLESDTNEILLLRGSSKAKDKKDGGGGGGSMVKNSLWLYSISRNKWSCIYSYDSCQSKAVRAALNGTNVPREPCPRYAHQLVYDHATRTHYLFGGNPGTGCRQLRLDDFWSLRLVRVTKEQLHRKFQFIIRRQRFKEISQVDPVKAIKFLRMNIGPLVDENDRDQVKELHSLAGSVCDPVVDNEDCGDGSPKLRNNVVDSRVQVFDLICSYFPETITQPKTNLFDLVVL